MLGLTLVILAMLPAACFATVWPDNHAYSRGKCGDPDASYNGTQAYLEVNNGSISSSDNTDQGFIAETVWALNASVSWVEVGYTRGWEGDNTLCPYWACYTLNSNYFEHRVTSTSVSPGDNPLFTIKKKPNEDNAWFFLIDGAYASDSTGDHTANSSLGNTFTKYYAGLESACSSGKLGSSSDHIGVTAMKKSFDDGDTWSFGPATSYQLTDRDNYSYGDWTTSGHSSWNYRNY